MLSKVNAERAYHYLALPAVQGAVSLGVVKFGHLLGTLTKLSGWQAGLIGIVQGAASKVLFDLGIELAEKLVKKANIDLPGPVVFGVFIGVKLAANTLSAAALLAISALAVKAGIMTSAFALSGLVVLTIANTVLSLGGFFFEDTVIEALQKQKLVAK